MKFELFQSEKSEKYHFNLKAKNGQVILSSQGYASKANAKKGIESVRKNAGIDDHYEIKEASNGKWFFNLLAGNKQVIGTSQMYASKSGLENGIDSVKTNGPEAEIEEVSAE
jgi:uncharacterized protein YegP (UPF0339 family)